MERLKAEILEWKALAKFSSWYYRRGLQPSEIPRMEAIEELLHVAFEENIETLQCLELEHTFLFPLGPTSRPLPKPLTAFKELLFTHDADTNVLSSAKEVLAQSSILENLNIALILPDQCLIQDIIPSRSVVNCLPIRSLFSGGNFKWLSNFPAATMPTFTHLRHLTLRNSHTEHNDLSELWDTLRTTSVRFKSLHLMRPIIPALVRYLTSYRGLQELLLTIKSQEQFITRAESDSIVACRSHASTLKRLATHEMIYNPNPTALLEEYERRL